MIKSVFHVNINVTNFERSLAFYKMVGFKVILDLGEGGEGDATVPPRHESPPCSRVIDEELAWTSSHERISKRSSSAPAPVVCGL